MGRLTTHVLDTAQRPARRRHPHHAVPQPGRALRAGRRRGDQRRRPLRRAAARRRRRSRRAATGWCSPRRVFRARGHRAARSAVRRRGRARLRRRRRRRALPRAAARVAVELCRPTAAAERCDGSLRERLAAAADPLGPPHHRHRVDRRVVLFRLARQQPAAARSARRTPTRASAASCGRSTAAASTTCEIQGRARRRCRSRCTGSSGRRTGRGCPASRCFVVMYYAHAERVHDRQERCGHQRRGRRSRLSRRAARRRLDLLRPAVQARWASSARGWSPAS